MRILIISRTSWDNSNSFGNTFSNIFGGIKDLEIYNVCCQEGDNTNSIVQCAYQMTDRTVLESIEGKAPGHIIEIKGSQGKKRTALTSKITKRRYTLFYIVRDMIWYLGHWWNAELKNFLDKVNPDIIYLPLYASWYMCDVQQKIADYCNVPLIGHISDDLYSYPPKALQQPLAYLYRANVRRKIRKLITKCAYVEVFAENMAKEYAKIFKKSFFIIGKGIDVSKVKDISIQPLKKDSISYVYTGNIGNGRYLELAKLAKSLDKYYPAGNAELKIYTQSIIVDEMKQTFASCRSLKLCGAVSSDEIRFIQQRADVLVHVESFSVQSIFETRMSFSTKLIDYMQAGKIIYAIGPVEVNSLAILRKYNLAVTACSDEEIGRQVEAIKNDEIDTAKLSCSIQKYLVEYRDIQKIQEGMINRMREIMV